MLILVKQQKQYIYNHKTHLVFVSSAEEESMAPGYKALDNVKSEKVIGKEKVSGSPCVKKEVVTSYNIMGQTIKNKVIVWENSQFEFPLRTMGQDGEIQEMRQIKEGKPAAKLFRPMPGYKRVNDMMAVMGMDIHAMQKEDPDSEKNPPEDTGHKKVDIQAYQAQLEQQIAMMEQQTGEKMNPEDKAHFMAMMGQVMTQADQSQPGTGASRDLWKIIPRHGSDQVGYEMKIGTTLDVILGTQSTLRQIFDFYGTHLQSKGWEDGGTYIQNGHGTITMRKGNQHIRFTWADRPVDIQGDYALYYNVHYMAE
ncbi:MAG: hypothetical protein HUN05_23635 [Desulfobacter sp.]|nr:MAG: hypothetical protein HUN05_23635 [Desulfobacter sp.]